MALVVESCQMQVYSVYNAIYITPVFSDVAVTISKLRMSGQVLLILTTQLALISQPTSIRINFILCVKQAEF